MNGAFVYIIANEHNSVLYIGVTNNLERRIEEHRSGLIKGFSKRYNLSKLIYFENFISIIEAIAREKEIKKWSRMKKEKLINKMNSHWKDLSSRTNEN